MDGSIDTYLGMKILKILSGYHQLEWSLMALGRTKRGQVSEKQVASCSVNSSRIPLILHTMGCISGRDAGIVRTSNTHRECGEWGSGGAVRERPT